MLVVGAILMIAAGIVFVTTDSFLLLLLAATVGVISPSGNEVGPFLSIEQAALSQVVADRERTSVFAWYALAGSLATAAGSLGGGALIGALQAAGASALTSYRFAVAGYAVVGMVLALIFARLSAAVEARPNDALSETSAVPRPTLGLSHSQPTVLRLSGLFALDAFAGGFVIQSIAAYWFHVRFGVSPAVLGGIFFGANVFAGLSALLAAKLAARIGLVNTMVFTHLPSNVLLILIPFMPNLPLAILVLLLRFSISQMDVPTRQSYVMAVVSPEERSAAAGVTSVARTTGAALAPVLAGPLLAYNLTLGLPFLVAGGLKVVYDLLLYRAFRRIKPPEERQPPQAATQVGDGLAL
jgi:MFS family permease